MDSWTESKVFDYITRRRNEYRIFCEIWIFQANNLLFGDNDSHNSVASWPQRGSRLRGSPSRASHKPSFALPACVCSSARTLWKCSLARHWARSWIYFLSAQPGGPAFWRRRGGVTIWCPWPLIIRRSNVAGRNAGNDHFDRSTVKCSVLIVVNSAWSANSNLFLMPSWLNGAHLRVQSKSLQALKTYV